MFFRSVDQIVRAASEARWKFFFWYVYGCSHIPFISAPCKIWIVNETLLLKKLVNYFYHKNTCTMWFCGDVKDKQSIKIHPSSSISIFKFKGSRSRMFSEAAAEFHWLEINILQIAINFCMRCYHGDMSWKLYFHSYQFKIIEGSFNAWQFFIIPQKPRR